MLANGINTLQVANVETIIGGSSTDAVWIVASLTNGTIDLGAGTDLLTLAAGGNTVTVSNVEAISAARAPTR